MINVEQVTVNIRMPSDQMRIVAMQPFVQFHTEAGNPPQEPFRWSRIAVDEQLKAIRRTLDISQDSFQGKGANFTVFPEYSVPGIGAASEINEQISKSSWPNDTVVIAGVHGLSNAEYTDLCRLFNTNVSPSNTPSEVPYDKWVNCEIVWIKEHDGKVRTWVQPKIRPAWPEMNASCNDMFCGSTVYVFEGMYEPTNYPCRFMSFICFDWVAAVAGSNVWREVVRQLNQKWTHQQPTLDWVFIIQHNTKPNHPSFLQSTYQFLVDNSYAFVHRDKAVVLHANTAVSRRPARTGSGGFSACVFSPSAPMENNSCRPTVCTQPTALRGSEVLERCKDVVFREMGECIHVFGVRVPRFVTNDATDRTHAVPNASVYATGDSDDPRLRGCAIPAAVKWINDSLDQMRLLSATGLLGCHLSTDAEEIEPGIVNEVRRANGKLAARRLNWAACSYSNKEETRNSIRRNNADLWAETESQALEHLLHSLTSIGLSYKLDIGDSILHGTINTDLGIVQIVAIKGETYEDCRRHYDEFIAQHSTDPVLVIARDHDNFPPVPGAFARLDEINSGDGLAFVDFQTLVNDCRTASDIQSLKEMIDAVLPGDRPII